MGGGWSRARTRICFSGTCFITGNEDSRGRDLQLHSGVHEPFVFRPCTSQREELSAPTFVGMLSRSAYTCCLD